MHQSVISRKAPPSPNGRGVAAALAVGVIATVAGSFALAQDSAEFYRGKEIKWILSAGAGGGYSTYAQAFAPFLSAHLPGKPNIVVQNMPGAGGLRAMQYLSAAAPKDGTVIGLVHSSVPFAPLFGMAGANFDPRKFNWIGSLNSAGEICASWHTSGIRTWRDMLDKQFIVGGTGGGSQMETLPEAINKIFGTKIKIISGYNSGNDVYLAMERGEVMGRCSVSVSSINATRPDWFPQKKVTVPIQIALRRSPFFPDVPALIEFAKDARTKEMLEMLLAYQDMDRPMLAPPGTTPERVSALRKAFHDGMNDPGFIAEAKRMRLEIDEVSGDKLAKILDASFALPADVIKAAKDAMNLTGNANEAPK